MSVRSGHNGWTIVTLDGVVRDDTLRVPSQLAFKYTHEGNQPVIAVAADLNKRPGHIYGPPPTGGLDGMGVRPTGFERFGDVLKQNTRRSAEICFPQPDVSIEKIASDGFYNYVRFDIKSPLNDHTLGDIVGALRAIDLPMDKADQMALHRMLEPKEIARA